VDVDAAHGGVEFDRRLALNVIGADNCSCPCPCPCSRPRLSDGVAVAATVAVPVLSATADGCFCVRADVTLCILSSLCDCERLLSLLALPLPLALQVFPLEISAIAASFNRFNAVFIFAFNRRALCGRTDRHVDVPVVMASAFCDVLFTGDTDCGWPMVTAVLVLLSGDVNVTAAFNAYGNVLVVGDGGGGVLAAGIGAAIVRCLDAGDADLLTSGGKNEVMLCAMANPSIRSGS
jgi:hypothetical protein